MYAIFIRGRKDPLTCDDVLGRRIKDQWVKGSEGLITIDGATFSSRTIYRVEANWKPEPEDARASSTQGEMDRKTEERRKDRETFEKYIRGRRKLTPEARAKDLDLAKNIWYANTGERDIPAEIAAQIIERQEQFFRDHPEDAYANPICYRDLIRLRDESYKSAVPPITFHLRRHAIDMAERVIQASFTVQ